MLNVALSSAAFSLHLHSELSLLLMNVTKGALLENKLLSLSAMQHRPGEMPVKGFLL